MSILLCDHAYTYTIQKVVIGILCAMYHHPSIWITIYTLVRCFSVNTALWIHLQDVVNDPNASDAIAKSVDSSKNRYLNTRTCKMSCTVHMHIMSHDLA